MTIRKTTILQNLETCLRKIRSDEFVFEDNFTVQSFLVDDQF